jgi:hypothetical protein
VRCCVSFSHASTGSRIGAVKQIRPWASLPDSPKHLSNPPVWTGGNQKLAKMIEKHLTHQQISDSNQILESPCGSASADLKKVPMRRTLFAIAFAVLVSMLLAPHGDKPGVGGGDRSFRQAGWTYNLVVSLTSAG